MTDRFAEIDRITTQGIDTWEEVRVEWRDKRRAREALACTLADIADEWDVIPELTALLELR